MTNPSSCHSALGHRLSPRRAAAGLFICLLTAGPAFAQPAATPPASADYMRQVDALIPDLAANDIVAREQAQQQLERLCFDVGTPGHTPPRAALCEVLCARLGSETPQPARLWLLRLLETSGIAESVEPVARLFADPDAEIRDAARRALLNNPSDQAADALRAALASAQEPGWQVALINALATRRDANTTAQLVALTRAVEAPVFRAAVAALAEMDAPEALACLRALWQQETAERRECAGTALVRVGDRLIQAAKSREAAQIYRELYQVESAPLPLRAAALRGLAHTQPTYATPLLVSALRGKQDKSLRLPAVRWLAESGGAGTTRLLVDEMSGAPPEVQAALLDALGARGDMSGRPAVRKALKAKDATVRLAAVRALENLGGKGDIAALVALAAEPEPESEPASEPEQSAALRDAARHTLARLTAPEVDETLQASLHGGTPALVIACIEALQARLCRPAWPALLELARGESEPVAAAAFEALGVLAGAGDLAELMKLLGQARSDDARSAGEDAVGAICVRIEPAEQRVPAVLAAWDAANNDPAHQSESERRHGTIALLHILGRLGGPAALDRVHTARTSGDAAVVDAAIRTLAKWPTADVLPELLEIAESDQDEARRVLALQGYIRLLALPNERDLAASVQMYRTALRLANRPEDKKAILSGVATVRHLDALAMVEEALTSAGLRTEAEAAVLSSARVVGVQHRDEARAAIERVKTQAATDATREQADQLLAALRRWDGYITTWQFSGPYFEAGLDGAQVYDQAFPPEAAGSGASPDVEWHMLEPISADSPWSFDLAKSDKNPNRCMYARAEVWSEHEQNARLEVGSDDAVKVWLSDRLVHESKAARAHTAFQDKVSVTLRPGWNALLLKVVQYSGEWGFSCGVQGLDGQALPGLKFRAE